MTTDQPRTAREWAEDLAGMAVVDDIAECIETIQAQALGLDATEREPRVILNYSDERDALTAPELRNRVAELERDYGLLREIASELERERDDARDCAVHEQDMRLEAEARIARLTEALPSVDRLRFVAEILPEYHDDTEREVRAWADRIDALLAESGARAARPQGGGSE